MCNRFELTLPRRGGSQLTVTFVLSIHEDRPPGKKQKEKKPKKKNESPPLTKEEVMRGLALTPQFEYGMAKPGVSLELKLQRWYRKAAEYNIAVCHAGAGRLGLEIARAGAIEPRAIISG